ncbi:MAG: outer membrane protein assembly factor BamC [Gammaproteobacteria bacterium]|nr:outer membrane protein assembly factor BamC [Gammaproteobacteria bacterium]
MKPIKLIFILSLAQLAACSQFFPDKEKDYIYSKEAKPLDIPPYMQAEGDLPQLDPVLMPATLSNTVTYVDEGTATYLRVNSPFAHAWRVVGKALTASSIEITDKNRSFATYYVQYDPDFRPVTDGSFWDEVVFFFADDPNQEVPYQVYLTQTERGTNIIVKDTFGDAINHGDGLKLLNLLHDTIEKDFAK